MQGAFEPSPSQQSATSSSGSQSSIAIGDESEAVELRDCRIADIVAENDVSVRLANSIAQAATLSKLPLETVGEYLDAGSQASGILMGQVRNFGRKSARELEELIIAECSGWNSQTKNNQNDLIGDVEFRRSDLLPLIAGDTLGEIAKSEILSTRLANVLKRPEFAEIPLTDVLSDKEKIAARLLRSHNCGRTSVNEFHTMCAKHVGLRLRESGLAGEELETATSILLLGESRSARSPNQSDGATAASKAPDLPPDHSSLAERLNWLLAELDERACDIVRRRNGIGQDCPETLEEIGTSYGVTRERIRQIESKSLRRISKRIRRVPIIELLNAEASLQWQVLSEGKPTLLIDELHERRRRVSPYVSLALDITDTTLSKWLDRIACRFPLGWRETPENSDVIEEAAACLEGAIAEVPLPRAAGAFEGCGSSEIVAEACELISGHPVYLGYVMPARVGARLARLVGLHSLLCEIGLPAQIENFLLDYHSRFPDDICSVRDAEIVMTAAPHLFLEIEEGRWHALGTPGSSPGAAVEQAKAMVPPAEEPGTIAHALQTTLRRRGPTKLGDLLEDADDILPEGRSVNSIGPVLLTRRELFVRALPGVYALPEQVPDKDELIASHLGQLFNTNQARLYALARYSGEGRDIFPFWSARSEYELCRWARHSGGGKIFSSLLAISEIELWPIAESEKEQWHEVKRRQGTFRLGTALRHASAYDCPDLDRVLAACIYAKLSGSLNWMAANRLTGRKIDSHGGAGLVALLVQLGVLEEPETEGYCWQMPHRVTEAAETIGQLLAERLARDGTLQWESDLGKDIIARVRASERTHRWVSATEVISMVGSFGKGEPEPDNDPVDAILQEHKRVREADRREATLQWLLED